MVNPVTTSLSNIASASGGSSPVAKVGSSEAVKGTSFSEMLKNNIDEVSRMQQDASKAVEDLALGKTDDVTGVMTAVEKSDMAFKTLLAIRSKLMDAYQEIKQIGL